jgi:hypothetical protein
VPGTLETLALRRREQKKLIDAWPEGIVFVSLLGSGSFGRTDSDLRRWAAAIAIARDYAPHVRAAAYVLELKRVERIVAQASLAALNLVVQPRYPHRVFVSVDAGVRWLAPQAHGAEVEALARSVEAVRSALE